MRTQSARGTRDRILFILMTASVLAGVITETPACAQETSTAAEIASGDSCWNALQSGDAFAHYMEAGKQGAADCEIAFRLARVYTAFALTARNAVDETWNFDHAKEYAERAIACDSNNEESHIALAVYFGWRTFIESDNADRLRASRRMYEEVTHAIALNPNDDFAWNILAQWNREVAKLSWMQKLAVKIMYGGLPDASFEQSISDLQRAIQLRPQRIMHYVELGKTFAAAGRHDDARMAWQHAMELPNTDGVDVKMKEEAGKLLNEMK